MRPAGSVQFSRPSLPRHGWRRPLGGVVGALTLLALAACAPTSGEDQAFDPRKTTNTDFTTRTVALGSRPITMDVRNIDGDDSKDVAASNRFGNTVTVLTEGLTVSETLAVGQEPTDVLFGDFNGADDLDLAVLSEQGTRLTVFINTGASWSSGTDFDLAGVSTQVSLIDLDGGGGAQDLVVSVSGAGLMVAFVNDGDGNFTPVLTSTADGPQRFVVDHWDSGDFPDIAVIHPIEDIVSVLIGDGLGGFTVVPAGGLETKNNPADIATADFNGDGNPDFALTNRFSDKVSVFRGDGSGGFTLLDEFDVKDSPTNIVAGAFTGDVAGSRDDLATIHRSRRVISVLLWNEEQQRHQVFVHDVSRNPTGIAVGDFNADDLTDIITVEA
ncbi:MAG: VCBS repeat-containing protein, partial [SAR324 cluster bacterium]|nr:VCBS repeat-containing protein [SAR324 cluster bacterium]